MNVIELPALDGRLPLGFLAACGVLRLLDAASPPGAPAPRLSWDDHSGAALLHADTDLDGVVATLHRVAASVADGALLPGGPEGFPGASSPEEWPRGDPMRMPTSEFRPVLDGWRRDWGSSFLDAWVPAMVTDLSADEYQCAELSPFAAPSGQQKFATMFAKPLELVRKDPDLLRQALVGWQRIDGVTGEYLDHHVLRSAADSTEGKSVERGVPGATWLALMSLPWFPVWSDGQQPLAGGWQARRRRRPLLVWPLWSPALDAVAAPGLATHPLLRADATRGQPPIIDLDALRPLGVFLVCAAERQSISGRNFAGVLTAVPVQAGRTLPRNAPA